MVEKITPEQFKAGGYKVAMTKENYDILIEAGIRCYHELEDKPYYNYTDYEWIIMATDKRRFCYSGGYEEAILLPGTEESRFWIEVERYVKN